MTVHSETRIIPHKPEDLFELVADVKRYPEFLPWCLAARIRTQTEKELIADLIIGFQVFKEQFTSKVAMDKEALFIDTSYADGPFKYLQNHWKFLPHKDGCEIDFYVDFELKNSFFNAIMTKSFQFVLDKIADSFQKRAEELFQNT